MKSEDTEEKRDSVTGLEEMLLLERKYNPALEFVWIASGV